MYDISGNTILEFKNGNGKGKEYNDEGKLIFEGEYINGEKQNGRGKEYYQCSFSDDIIIFDGEYKNGKKNRNVKEIDNINDYIILNLMVNI